MKILDAASTTSTTVVNHAKDLDGLLLNVIGLSNSGTSLLASSKDSIVGAINTLAPTTDLLMKYNPVYTCWLQGSTWFLDHGGFDVWGGANGRSIQLDVGLLLGNDPYALPGQPARSSRRRVAREVNQAAVHYRMRRRTSQCAR